MCKSVIKKIEKIRREKEAAVMTGDFEKAAALRDEEYRLSKTCEDISSANRVTKARKSPLSIILFPFIILSIAGLVLSLIVHVSALLGYDAGLGQSVFILRIGIFVVWIPTILVSIRTTANFRQKDFWKAALRGCPPWMRNLTCGFFIYAIINFAIFIFLSAKQGNNSSAGAPSIADIRGFSGHWMAFYSAALAVLYSATKIKNRSPLRKCPNGHTVSELSNYCEICGNSICREG